MPHDGTGAALYRERRRPARRQSARLDDLFAAAMHHLHPWLVAAAVTGAALSIAPCTGLAQPASTPSVAGTPLPPGLVYKSLREGGGASPTAADTVKVNYRGTLVDGTEFDSSYKRNAPATFPLGRVIPCWTAGVQKMKPGGKAELICPPNLAY